MLEIYKRNFEILFFLFIELKFKFVNYYVLKNLSKMLKYVCRSVRGDYLLIILL